MPENECFDSTVALFEVYRKKMKSESCPSYNNTLALEVRKRLKQLSFLSDKVRDYEQKFNSSSIADVLGVNVEELPSRSGSIQLLKSDAFDSYRSGWFELEFYVESFYYIADRIRKVLNHKTKNTFPGLKNFRADGVRDVRNKVLAHPEDFGQISVPSIDRGRAEEPRLRTAKSVPDMSSIVDCGFWINAKEFKNNLEKLLKEQVGCDESHQ